jgi:hypothetical protein
MPVQVGPDAIVVWGGGPDTMEGLATWSPALYLTVSAVEREESRWLVTLYRWERAGCPICGVESSSRHSIYSRTLGDL